MEQRRVGGPVLSNIGFGERKDVETLELSRHDIGSKSSYS